MSQEQQTPDSVPSVDGMPRLGLGTWQNTDPDQCRESVQTALETGYRHVDTAQAYDNEVEVGDGIAAADVDRDDVFLATKIWTDNLSYDDVIHTARESLNRLGVDYLDLLYVHWPSGEYDAEDTLAAFAELYDDGLIDRVGVSNFLPEQVREATEVCDAPIFANQVEMHPLLPQEDLQACAEREDVNLVAYSPLARGRVFDVPEIQAVAKKHDASAAQVSLAWLLEKGATPIPKATSEDHIRDNWSSLSIELDEDDIETIDGIDRQERQVDPGFAPW
ncbi:aldo/keto reductase [Halostella sp. PRR32]|uniref:aldo/keto reductase n=1 Tax=Halostella sp. PRR32 TaxID=3098147 RepID=UPI00110E1274|nr:aldo/keto reductase [Halostella sp. PRR32]